MIAMKRRIQQSIIKKANTQDKKHGKHKWEILKSLLLESSLNVKEHQENYLTIDIEGTNGDIEVFPIYHTSCFDGSFVHVQLWFYEFKRNNNFYEREVKQRKTVSEALSYINYIINEVTFDNKNGG